MKIIMAIDPGRDKTGLAIVDENLNSKEIKIVKSTELKESIFFFLEKYKAQGININTIAIGDGTCSKKYYDEIKNYLKDQLIDLVFVDEYNTTAEARLRYWECNPPSGLKKLLPISWLTPPVPVDDYTAWIIGERYFRGNRNEENK